MQCKRNQIKNIKYCAGDLRQRIKFTERTENVFDINPLSPGFKFTEKFSCFAGIETLSFQNSGNTIRDGVNISDGATHRFIIRYRDNITSELFIEFKGYRYNIISTSNLNEQNQWINIMH